MRIEAGLCFFHERYGAAGGGAELRRLFITPLLQLDGFVFERFLV